MYKRNLTFHLEYSKAPSLLFILGVKVAYFDLQFSHLKLSSQGYANSLTFKMTEVVTDQTPPILHGPSDKEKKYDRQLRLWAAQGQQALEDAHILLINSGSGTVGVETLKNLVLPGMRRLRHNCLT